MNCTTLDDYLSKYGGLLGQQAQERLDPLHVPGRDPLPDFRQFKRQPFPAQQHTIAASVKALRHQKSIALIGQMGTGKAQPLNAKVLTPTGWVSMGDLRAGDVVANPEGGDAVVTAVFPQGEKDVYRVTFSDGSSTECCDDHLWAVRTPQEKLDGRPFRVLPLRDIKHNLHLSSKHSGGEFNSRYYIPLATGIGLVDRDLPLDPYLLGVLLGDGCLASPVAVSFSSADEFIVGEVRAAILAGVGVTQKAGNKGLDWSISSGRRFGKNAVLDAIRDLGLAGCKSADKSIPPSYLHASREQRIALLRGLMDTDGHCVRGFGLEYVTVSEQLSRDVIALVRSLGGTAKVRHKLARYTHKGEKRVGQIACRLYIRMPRGINPFRLPRKANAYKGAEKYGPSRAIVKVEWAGKKPCQCIMLDSKNHLYVTDDYIVTHNTLMGMTVVHTHAADSYRGYRALVFCPGQLVLKWEREILETVPGARVTIIESCHQLNRIRAKATSRWIEKPTGAWLKTTAEAEWYVIARDRAKLGAKWAGQHAGKVGRHARLPQRGGLRCPRCAGRLETKDGTGLGTDDLGKKMTRCDNPHPDEKKAARGVKCGEQLWSYYGPQKGGLNRFEPAKYVHKRMRGFFDYLIVDEFHEEKSADSAQANAAGSLMAACKKVVCLSGTLIGGYAEHVRPILFRMAPQSLVEEGLGWKDATAFNRKYGRIERTVITRSDARDDGRTGRQSRGSGRKMTEAVKPGIVPTLFGRHLLGNSLYLSLAELSDRLPPLREVIVPVEMDPKMAEEYRRDEDDLVRVNKELCVGGNKALLGPMLNYLLCYPDLPYDWEPVGYSKWIDGEKHFIPDIKPRHLDEKKVWPKERKLVETVKAERDQGRKCWVFVQYTDTRPVLARMERLLKEAGLRVKVMRASVSPIKREAWIAENAPDADVIVSHPKLVETGLDFFDKARTYNVPTIMFYETGYNLFTLRQAAARAWRIGQRAECRVYYFYYAGTAQEAAMTLMGKKLSAAQALEGKFSADGLVAMGGDDVSVEMALARSLEGQMKGDAARAWATIADATTPAAAEYRPAETDPDDEPISDEESAELLALFDDVDVPAADDEDDEWGDLSDVLDGWDDLLAAV